MQGWLILKDSHPCESCPCLTSPPRVKDMKLNGGWPKSKRDTRSIVEIGQIIKWEKENKKEMRREEGQTENNICQKKINWLQERGEARERAATQDGYTWMRSSKLNPSWWNSSLHREASTSLRSTGFDDYHLKGPNSSLSNLVWKEGRDFSPPS